MSFLELLHILLYNLKLKWTWLLGCLWSLNSSTDRVADVTKYFHVLRIDLMVFFGLFKIWDIFYNQTLTPEPEPRLGLGLRDTV